MQEHKRELARLAVKISDEDLAVLEDDAMHIPGHLSGGFKVTAFIGAGLNVCA